MIYQVRPLAGLLVVVALMGACGDAAGRDDDGVTAAASEAADAAAVVTDLVDRVEALESDLEAEKESRSEFQDSLRALERSLDKSIDDLKETVRELRSDLANGRGDIDEALARIGALSGDIAVLDQRLDYHLRNHGG